MTDFQDHFSARAEQYAKIRPHYPSELFDWLAQQAPGRRLALDVATGNGQAAVPLANRFARVVATDASAEQLRRATRHPGIEYRRALAHESGLQAGAADLVTVAQALHWIDRSAFYAEVWRVLAPGGTGGVVAAWCYSLMRCGPAIDEVVDRFYHDVVPRPVVRHAGGDDARGAGGLSGHLVGDGAVSGGAGGGPGAGADRATE